MISEKSGMEPDRVTQSIDLLFQYIEVVPADDFHPAIEKADEAIGDTDPDDVLYLACAIASDAAIWSDDSDFDEQDLVERYSTSDVIYSFDTHRLILSECSQCIFSERPSHDKISARPTLQCSRTCTYRWKQPPRSVNGRNERACAHK
jgi:predicted nucleic acid-binding protein